MAQDFFLTPKNVGFSSIFMTPEMSDIFGKLTSPRDFVVLGGPAGGEALERDSPVQNENIT